MDSYSHYTMCAPGRSALPGRVLLALLLALALLALGAVAAPGRVRAANGQQITFASPVYAGQNNGFAEGPVGAVVTVNGSGWASAAGPVSIDLVDTQLDAAGQSGSACTSAPANKRVEIADLQPNPVTVSKTGSFTATFTWPSGANAVGHSYWACGGQGGATFPGTDKYTVLGANPPSLSIGNNTTIPVKSTITVKGKNWLPGNQQITVLLTPCVNCDAQPLLTQNTTAGSDGSFSLDITLPDQVTAGTTVYVIASNQASAPDLQPALIVNGQNNAPKITVVDQPTATPTPSPTVTNTPVPTRTTSSGSGTGNTSNGSPSNGLLIVLLSALGVVLVLAAVVAVLLFVRSRKPLPDSPPYGGPGGYPPQGGGYSGQYAGPRRTGGSGPPSDYTNLDYYNEPPRSGGRSGPSGGYGQRGAGWGGQGWQGGQQGQLPDDSASGDQPTISSPPPWR